MMFDILIYGSAVALLFSLAGLAIEQLAAWRGWPRRGIWAVALVASLVLPATMVTRPHSSSAVPVSVAPSVPAAPMLASTRFEPIITTPAAMKPIPIPVSHRYFPPSFDKVCQILWVAMSAGLLGSFALSWARLGRARRRWRREAVDGCELWVTRALGPAVLGFFKPQVVVPQWILNSPAATRSMVLVHENEHIGARDPLLLLAGFLVVLLLPWNLLLWWQLRRLRFAVEVDCDARVLRRVADLQTYADVLLAVNQRGALAPWGAMAIASRVSQLERRVRIMTSLRRPVSRLLIGAAVGLCVACVAIAVDLNAPTLSDSELRKPPLHDWSPFLPKAEAAARAAYPQLFQGQFSGTVALAVDLNLDGEVLDIRKRDLPAGPESDEASDLGAEWLSYSSDMYITIGSFGRKFIGWFGPDRTNGLYVSYQVLKWPRDPARSAARVRAAVAAQYPEFFRPYPSSERSQQGKHKLLTVFMDDDGTINRQKLSDADGAAQTSGSERAQFNLFLDLGLTPDQFAHRALTTNIPDSRPWYRYPDEPSLVICYAWPRHPDDPPDEAFRSHAVFKRAMDKWLKEREEQVPDAAFLKHYFPDAWEHGPTNASEHLWILLDRQGRVWDAGRSRYDFAVLEKELEAKYPGTRISLGSGEGAETASGRDVRLDFMWLGDDSPVTDRAGIDYSKQHDLIVIADECRKDTECGSVPFVMNFGVPVVTWISGLHVQLTAADAGPGYVDLQLQTQPIAGGAQSLSSNWSAPGSPLHVADGGEASAELVDQDGQSWRIALHPQQLKP